MEVRIGPATAEEQHRQLRSSGMDHPRTNGHARGREVDGDQTRRRAPADEAARQVELCNRNLCMLANNFSDAGFTPVIDWVIPDREQLDLFVSLLPDRQVQFVVLAPGIEACRYRNTIRDPVERFDFDGYEDLDADMKRELGGVGWWFDTAALTPEETADRVIREARHRAPVNPHANVRRRCALT
ncbi:phosphotransferase [Streptomyces ferrugineus]|uniref:phosphotransferase n=1 Tax=Streptomyces ferrugineus TaxID=1413221 RepID=UPI001D135A7D|nr:phosphotransferase [Streptomyces ferrugineus]